MVLKLPGFSGEKCNSAFATDVEMHHVECCDGTNGDFQPWIRAILRVPSRVTWKFMKETNNDVQRAVQLFMGRASC